MHAARILTALKFLQRLPFRAPFVASGVIRACARALWHGIPQRTLLGERGLPTSRHCLCHYALPKVFLAGNLRICLLGKCPAAWLLHIVRRSRKFGNGRFRAAARGAKMPDNFGLQAAWLAVGSSNFRKLRVAFGASYFRNFWCAGSRILGSARPELRPP